MAHFRLPTAPAPRVVDFSAPVRALVERCRQLRLELGAALEHLERDEPTPLPGAAGVPELPGFSALFARLGRTGLRPGDLLELCGPPDSGKRALGLGLARAVQQAGRVAAIIDPAGEWPAARLARAGLDGERTLVLRLGDPARLHAALRELVASRRVSLVLFAPDVLGELLKPSGVLPERLANGGMESFDLDWEPLERNPSGRLAALLREARLAGTALVAPFTRLQPSARGGLGGGLRLALRRLDGERVDVRAERGPAPRPEPLVLRLQDGVVRPMGGA